MKGLFFLFGALAVLLLVLFLAADHVFRRFQHTTRSRRILMVEGGFSLLAAGWILARMRIEPGLGVLLALVLAGTLFVTLAFGTVELWRRRKQGDLYREIAALRRQKHLTQQTLDRLRWEMERLRRLLAEARSDSRQEAQVSAADVDRQLVDLAKQLARRQEEIARINERLDHWHRKKTDLEARKMILD